MDVPKENVHSCNVCGGYDFVKQAGYFYCQECQTQCEDVRELLFEDDGDNEDDENDDLLGTPFALKKGKKKKERKRKGENISSWEIFNFMLKGLMEELLAAGAPSSLTHTTLQLWAFYLQKLEVAFTSQTEELLPKLNVHFFNEDAEMLFGLKKKRKKKIDKQSTCTEMNSTIGGLSDWSSVNIERQSKRKAKKEFMKKIAESEAAYNISDQPTFSADLDDSLSLSSACSFISSSAFASNLDLNCSQARKQMLKYSDNNFEKVSNCESPLYLNKYKLIVLLYLALLYEGSQIQISDILRWIREGHLSYYNAQKFIPENYFISGKLTRIFTASLLPTYNQFYVCAKAMARYLEMEEWPDPDLKMLASKYVKELHLPEMFCNLVLRFVATMPNLYKSSKKYDCSKPVNIPTTKTIPNYEGRVLAIIIVIMKLFFGLDGKTEHKISAAASQLNKYMWQDKGVNTTKLFVWDNWVKQLTCRNAVLSKLHFPSRQLMNPEMFGDPNALANFCKKWHNANPGLYEKFDNATTRPYLKVAFPNLLNTFESILKKLVTPTSCKADIDFPQCFTPCSLYIRKIVEKSCTLEEPLLSADSLAVLSEDFSMHNIIYLLTPEILRSSESRVLGIKVKNGSAKKRFKKLKYNNRKRKIILDKREFFFCVKPERKQEPIPESDEDIVRRRKKMEAKQYIWLMRKGNFEEIRNIQSKKIKSQSTRYTKNSTSVPRKIKVKTLDAKNSQKRKGSVLVSEKPNEGKKLSNSLKFYVPSSQYWMCVPTFHGNERDFEVNLLSSCPVSFSWLLNECAILSEMSKLTLYREVCYVEKICRHFLNS